MIQKTGGNAVFPTELGYGTDPAQELFNNLAFEFDAELSLFPHDKILSALSGLKILSDSLTYCPNGGVQFRLLKFTVTYKVVRKKYLMGML